VSKYLLITEFRFNAMSCSNSSNENSDVGQLPVKALAFQ